MTVTKYPNARVVGVDLARGIALIGMAATHLLAVQDPGTGRLTMVGWLAAGRASALFALLAGASLALVTGGVTPKVGAARAQASVSIAVRAVVIGVFGLWLASTQTTIAVILAYYALLFVLALPFLGLGWRSLTWLALGWALVSPVVSHLWRAHLPPGPNAQVSFESLGQPLAMLWELFVIGYYPVLTWLTYLFAGLAVGRLDLRSAATAVRLLVVGVVLAAASWLLSAAVLAAGVVDRLRPPGAASTYGWLDLLGDERYGNTPPGDPRWLLVASPHSGTPLDLLGTTGSALAVLGGCLLLTRSALLRTLLRPVAAVGAMTLTLYLVHGLVLTREWGDWGQWGNVSYWLAHVVVALVFATVWLRFARRGPLETLVHNLASEAGALAIRRKSPATR